MSPPLTRSFRSAHDSRAMSSLLASLVLTLFLTGLSALAVPIAPAVAAEGQTAFANAQLAREAKSYADYLKRFRRDASKGEIEELLRQGRSLVGSDARAAARVFAVVAASAPENTAGWRGLANALHAYDPTSYQGAERYNVPLNASGAAYRAYEVAKWPADQTAALKLLSETLVRRSLWRLAIEALKAAVTVAPEPAVMERLALLKAEHGFRMTDYSTQSDSAEPRVCLEFSERLGDTDGDFSQFVSVNGADPQAVSAEGRQLCIGGLDHGTRYEIELRQGLPSVIADEQLARTVSIAAYVPDRKASVRFTGRAYVLPSHGQQGIPLVSVNTEKVKVEVFRIGDRSLVETLRNGSLESTLSQWEVSSIKEQKGEAVYAGVLDVGLRLNEEVTTAFPVSEAIGTLAPGVYAMTAEPAKPGDHGYQLATQWFIVSDLGLTAFTGDDGIHVLVRSLKSAEPMAATPVRLMARNNEVLATGTTDAKGYVNFAVALTRGEGGQRPALVVAQNGATDYAFLDLSTAAFDLTDRGVAGRNPPGPIDGYLYTERGVYRPGETVHLTGLVRDAVGRASGLPVTLIVTRPDGVEHRRMALTDGGLGGRTTNLMLSPGSMTGTWRARLHVDPKAAAISETAFLVEDFVPERLDLTLSAGSESIRAGEPLTVSAEGRFLYGPPGADLALEGEVIVRPAGSDKRHPGYRFGLADELVTPVRNRLSDLPRTDSEGKATIEAKLPALPKTVKPLEAQVIVRLAEPGGRTVERATMVAVETGLERIGVKPLFKGDRLKEGETARFDVVRLDGAGKALPTDGLTWTLKRLETRWQWYSRGGTWAYEPVTLTRQVATGTLDDAGSGENSGERSPAQISAAVNYGRYLLEVTGGGDSPTATSVAFSAGWFASADAPDSPEVLDVALDKESYRAGETAKLRIATRKGGRALIAVLGGKMHAMQEVTVPDGGGSVDIKVGDDWGPGAYATALLYRPMDVSAKRMPQRALGLAWLGLDQSAREIGVSLAPPEKIRSGETLTVPVTLKGLDAGEEARLTVAAVDLGILNLTRFKAPAPEAWFNARTKLRTEVRDFYGRLIDGMRAERGTLRSGGDADTGLQMSGTPPVEATVAAFSGIVTVGADGTALVSFDLPDFNGTVRLMAVAWSKTRTGHAIRDVIVRDPVAMTIAAPRFLTLGDSANLGFSLHNVDGAAGDYALTLTRQAPGDGRSRDTAQSPGAVGRLDVQLNEGQRVSRTLRVEPAQLGLHTFEIAVTGPDGLNVTREINLDVKPPAGDVRRTRLVTLGPGEDVTFDRSLTDGLIASRSTVSLAVGPAARFDVVGLIENLDRYPYGCAEQTVSRALPLVHADELAKQTGLAFADDVRERVQGAIDRVFEMQDSSGAFGAWGPSATNLWLTAYVADFLTRARDAGYRVDARSFDRALDRLANFIAYAQDFKSGGGDRAYALYVLARNGRAPMGELRYYADARLDRFSSAIAKAQLGAALALVGDRERAARAIEAAASHHSQSSAVDGGDYGSWLRDGAALLALSSEARVQTAAFSPLLEKVTEASRDGRRTSTQEQAWLLLAVKALNAPDSGHAVLVNGVKQQGPVSQRFSVATFDDTPLSVTNTGRTATTALVSAVGAANAPQPPTAQGLAITRSYYTLDGEAVNLDSATGGASTVQQNERFVVVVTLTPEKARGRLLLVDHLPAGFEVENPRLVTSGNVKSLSWLKSAASPQHTEFRDDRVVAAFDLYANGANEGQTKDGAAITVAYMVRAVTPGSYVHPAATAEDMYAPERHARTAAGRLNVVAR